MRALASAIIVAGTLFVAAPRAEACGGGGGSWGGTGDWDFDLELKGDIVTYVLMPISVPTLTALTLADVGLDEWNRTYGWVELSLAGYFTLIHAGILAGAEEEPTDATKVMLGWSAVLTAHSIWVLTRDITPLPRAQESPFDATIIPTVMSDGRGGVTGGLGLVGTW